MSNEKISQLIAAKPMNMENIKQERYLKLDYQASLLQEQEKMNDALNQVTFVKVLLFSCQKSDCKVFSKLFEKKCHFICNNHLKMVKQFYGQKYFWKCEKCNDKSYSYNIKHNLSKCQKCGHSKLIPTSAYNVSQIKTKDAKLQIKSNQTELRAMYN